MSSIILMFFIGVLLGFGVAVMMMNSAVKHLNRQTKMNKVRLKRAKAALNDTLLLVNQYEQGK
ncbi:hypothetical protein [Vibrio scophthalmi]|uniref:Uncharacterized protein n=1 Tax=Vibrio scophthalmi TaxID=45658 RepID=A0A1E3WH97_9VIBR|nr:hypothetical protein [Vibrio scophthalmi]ODS05150.1 hypothetical protein VSF3289_04291 [Vibrio scophthalmi]